MTSYVNIDEKCASKTFSPLSIFDAFPWAKKNGNSIWIIIYSDTGIDILSFPEKKGEI